MEVARGAGAASRERRRSASLQILQASKIIRHGILPTCSLRTAWEELTGRVCQHVSLQIRPLPRSETCPIRVHSAWKKIVVCVIIYFFAKLYRVFQKEHYKFGSLCKFIQTTHKVFWTVLKWKNTPSVTWDSYGSLWLSLVMQGVSKRDLQWYSKYCGVASVTKTLILKGVHTIHRSTPWTSPWELLNILYFSILLHSFYTEYLFFCPSM
jgi:hypothetical protein